VYPLVSLRVEGAVCHGAIRRNGVLERMLPRRRNAGLGC
jgi:cytochrome b561